MTSPTPPAFDCWAVVELFGHQRIAGHCTEETVAGAALLRVDAPEAGGRQAFTRYYGHGAIYGITPCSEEIARRVASHIRAEPLPVYLPELQPTISRPALSPGESDEDFEEVPL